MILPIEIYQVTYHHEHGTADQVVLTSATFTDNHCAQHHASQLRRTKTGVEIETLMLYSTNVQYDEYQQKLRKDIQQAEAEVRNAEARLRELKGRV